MKKSKQNNTDHQVFIDIKAFAKRYGLSEKTVRKRIDDIKGVITKERETFIIDSSRYPYNMRGNKVKSRDDKIYVLLKATSEFYYIDEEMLRISKTSFDTMVNELYVKGLLIKNGSNDPNGVNSYDVCQSMDELLRKSKYKAIKEISLHLSRMSGEFVGEYINASL